jgi:hypothetical protein
MAKYKSWKAFKADWVAALRSGEYRQGKEALCKTGRTADRFCCLGVAVNLLIEAGHDLEWEQRIDVKPKLLLATDTKGASDECEITCLNIPNWLYAKLAAVPTDSADPTCSHVTVEGLLTHLNDKGRSFKEIADFIDRQL